MKDLAENEELQKSGIVISCDSSCINCNPSDWMSCIEPWWTQALPIIEQIASVTGAIIGTSSITSWILHKLSKSKMGKELAWVKIILTEEEWSPSILAQLLGLQEDEAKMILKGFGYIWNPKKMLYVSTDATDKLRSIRISS